MRIFAHAAHLLITVLAVVAFQSHASARELIPDNHFRQGLVLWKPEPGKHVRYGQLPGPEENAMPVWGLSQWSSKYPLESSSSTDKPTFIYTNAAKVIRLSSTNADIVMAANTGVEYGGGVRATGTPWVHLLVEQEFPKLESLKPLIAAKFHVEARLTKSVLLDAKDYNPNVHAAQFQIYFTVQNRNQKSRGYGDLVWFCVPIYDNRARFAAEFKEKDFGGTEKFIFTPSGKTYTSKSTHDGEWVTIDKDILPLMRESLTTARSRGFLKDSNDIADYYIGGMNMGWELPGTFDVEMRIRNLSLEVTEIKADRTP